MDKMITITSQLARISQPAVRGLAGHAHWQNIAKTKGANDAKKSKLLTAWIPKIRTESRNESDLGKNPALRKLVQDATAAGVPKNNITQAVNAWKDKDFTEVQYGVQGGEFVALIDCATYSVGKMKNDIQTLLRRANFQYSTVSFQFDHFKCVSCNLPLNMSDDDLLELALLCGTEEYTIDREDETIVFNVHSDDQKDFFEQAKQQDLNIKSVSSLYVPKNMIQVTEKSHQDRILKFMNALDAHPEVEDIHHNIENFEITMDVWKKEVEGAKKTALVQGSIRKVHYEMAGNVQLAEDYDMKTGELLVRKWKRPSRIGRNSDWTYEVGRPPLRQQPSDHLWEASSAPYCYRQDSKTHFAWRIQPLTWPLTNYKISVEDDKIVVRTENKKYFKKIVIEDMVRCELPLHPKNVSCAHAADTLMISYLKPPAILQLEQTLYSDLCQIKPIQDHEMESCKQQ